MVALREDLYDSVLGILLPAMDTIEQRQALLISLLQGKAKYAHIKWEGASFEFTVHLIKLLSKDELIGLIGRLNLGEEWRENIESLCSRIKLAPNEPNLPEEQVSFVPGRSVLFSPPTVTLAIFFGFMGAWLFGPRTLSGPFALSVALASLIFLLFRLAEYDFKPEVKSLAARWMLKNGSAENINTARAFNQAFITVFDTHHFTAKSFARSTLISAFFLSILLLLSTYVLDLKIIRKSNEWVTLVLFGFVANVLGDYIAVLKTRLLLRRYEQGRSPYFILLIDVIATLVIFFTFIAGAIALIYCLTFLQKLADGSPAKGIVQDAVASFIKVVRQFYAEVTGDPGHQVLTPPDRVLLYCALLTTLMSSIWLWVSVLLGPAIRYLTKTRASAFSLIGLFFEVDRHPFTAMGYLSAIIILSLGIITWGGGLVISSL